MDLGFSISQGLDRDQRVFSEERGEDKLMKGLILSSVKGSPKGLWKPPAWKPLTTLPGPSGGKDCAPSYSYYWSLPRALYGSHTSTPCLPVDPRRARTRASKPEARWVLGPTAWVHTDSQAQGKVRSFRVTSRENPPVTTKACSDSLIVFVQV